MQRIPDESEFSIDDMLADLRELVEVESPSLDVDAVSASAKVLAAIIERRLGGTASLVDSPAGPHVHWVGGGEPKVLLLGHHDTVFPLGTLATRPFEVVDGRATGPGVFDMLGGIVQALHGLAALDDRSGVEILISADEEVGSTGSAGAPRGAGGGVRSGAGARAVGRWRAVEDRPQGDRDVRGAGPRPRRARGPRTGKGVNALIEASRQVLTISEFGAPETGTTVTPTVASAGTADNVVPAEARSASTSGWNRPASASVSSRRWPGSDRSIPRRRSRSPAAIGRPPMPESASVTLMPIAALVVPGITGIPVGGGSDGNFTAALGVPTLDGLGAVGGGAHADTEHLIVAAMPERARLVAGLVAHLTA